jgi:hypothetical protein
MSGTREGCGHPMLDPCGAGAVVSGDAPGLVGAAALLPVAALPGPGHSPAKQPFCVVFVSSVRCTLVF